MGRANAESERCTEEWVDVTHVIEIDPSGVSANLDRLLTAIENAKGRT